MSQKLDLRIRVRFVDDAQGTQARYSIFRHQGRRSERFELVPHFTMRMSELNIRWEIVNRDIRFVTENGNQAVLVYRDLNTGREIHNPPFEIDAPVSGRRHQICTTDCAVVPGRMTWAAVLFEMELENSLTKNRLVLDPTIICPQPVA